MIFNNLRLFIFLIILLVGQFLINNFTILYVDLFGILLVVSLLSSAYSWSKMVMFSLLADIFGHWYLGTHLFSIVIVSFITPNISNFYRMCGWFQRSLVTNVFFLIFNTVIYAIDIIFAKTHVSLMGVILELTVFMPVIQFLLDKFIINKSTEFIFYE